MLSDFNACIHKLTIHRQSGHGQHVAQQHYAINADFLRSLNPKMIKSFENASLAWHELFTTHESQQIENQPISNQSKKHSRAISNQLTLHKRERAGTTEKHKKSPHIDRALLGLQRIGGVNAHYRSENHLL